MKLGVAKSLHEALYRALCIGPLSGVEERGYEEIRSFLAERFQSAILRHEDCQDVLEELFAEIIKREFRMPSMTIEEWKKK